MSSVPEAPPLAWLGPVGRNVMNEYRYLFRTIDALDRGESRLSRDRSTGGRNLTLDRHIAPRAVQMSAMGVSVQVTVGACQRV
jgi:hypothetical protein